MTTLYPANPAELREICLERKQVRVVGTGSAHEWLPPHDGTQVSTKELNSIREFRADDLVIRVGAGTLIEDLQSVASKSGLCLPIPPPSCGWLGYGGQTVGGLLALGLPHFWQCQTGAIRDWIIAAKTMSTSGEEMEFGAQVVKSVAGFDVHKALVGSRGGLLILTEVTLRLYPLKLLPSPPEISVATPFWINLGLPSQFDSTGSHHAVDPTKRIIWSDQLLPGYNSIGQVGLRNPMPNPQIVEIQSQLKSLCDPSGVLIEGWAK